MNVFLFLKIIKTAQSCYGKAAFKMATFQSLAYFLIQKIMCLLT